MKTTTQFSQPKPTYQASPLAIAMIVAFFCWSLCAFPPPSVAQDPPRTHQENALSDPSEAWVAERIQKLKSERFAERQAASDELIRSGPTVLPRLKECSRQEADLDFQGRLHAIIATIEDRELQSRTKLFLRDLNSDHDHGFPGWDSFRRLAGKGRLSRQWMIDLNRHYPDLVQAVAHNPDQLPEVLTKTMESLLDRRSRGEVLEVVDGIAMMYGFVAGKKLNDPRLEYGTYWVISNSRLMSKLADRSWRNPLKPMLTQLYERTDFSKLEALSLAFRWDLPEGAILARKVLSDPPGDLRLYWRASESLAKFGSKEDILLFKPWLENETLFAELRSERAIGVDPNGLGQNPLDQIQYVKAICLVQDIALAASVLLSGEPLKEYCPRARVDELGWLQVGTLGFLEDEADLRKSALTKWKDRHAKN